MNTVDVLKKMGATSTNASKYASSLDSAMAEFSINASKNRKAMFLANIMHESGRLSRITENLMYSAERLLVVFPKYFTPALAASYAKQPQKIANRVYANRIGNGNEASGDGYKFFGRGLIQLTGRDNYTRCGTALGYDLVADPKYLETPAGASRSAAWFWNVNGLNRIADTGDFVAVVKRINGGTNGMVERRALLQIALSNL